VVLDSPISGLAERLGTSRGTDVVELQSRETRGGAERRPSASQLGTHVMSNAIVPAGLVGDVLVAETRADPQACRNARLHRCCEGG
jgi:hypothetical protein